MSLTRRYRSLTLTGSATIRFDTPERIYFAVATCEKKEFSHAPDKRRKGRASTASKVLSVGSSGGDSTPYKPRTACAPVSGLPGPSRMNGRD
ncbi:hypothetical protein BDV10DRAFT_157296 [Aspergillus recurvatus]